MADNVPVTNSGYNATIRTDELPSGAHAQANKILLGADGADDGFVASGNPLPVQHAGTLAVTQSTSPWVCSVSGNVGRNPDQTRNLVIAQLLSSDGVGTPADAALNVDGSSSPVRFCLRPSGSNVFQCRGLSLLLLDGSGMDLDEFGDLGAALTNGIELQVYDHATPAVITDLLGGLPLKKNADFLRVARSVERFDFGGAVHALRVWIDCVALFGQPLRIENSDNEQLELVVKDNLTGLTEFRATALGYYESTAT